MKISKSIAVGLVAAWLSIIAMVGAFTLRLFWLMRNYQSPKGTDIGVDLVSVFSNIPHHWLMVLLCFFIGFAWEFRRLNWPRRTGTQTPTTRTSPR